MAVHQTQHIRSDNIKQYSTAPFSERFTFQHDLLAVRPYRSSCAAAVGFHFAAFVLSPAMEIVCCSFWQPINNLHTEKLYLAFREKARFYSSISRPVGLDVCRCVRDGFLKLE